MTLLNLASLVLTVLASLVTIASYVETKVRLAANSKEVRIKASSTRASAPQPPAIEDIVRHLYAYEKLAFYDIRRITTKIWQGSLLLCAILFVARFYIAPPSQKCFSFYTLFSPFPLTQCDSPTPQGQALRGLVLGIAVAFLGTWYAYSRIGQYEESIEFKIRSLRVADIESVHQLLSIVNGLEFAYSEAKRLFIEWIKSCLK